MVVTVVAMLLGEGGRPHGVEEGAHMLVTVVAMLLGEGAPTWCWGGSPYGGDGGRHVTR